jgi:RNA methyltransferase, TrmH family
MALLEITSTKNDRIKALQRLEKASERRKEGVFLVEGTRELTKAIVAGFELAELYFCPNLAKESAAVDLAGKQTPLISVSQNVFETIAYRENRDGLLGVFKQKTTKLNDLKLGQNPLVIVLEAVEKPGNLGAILRTADAAGADAIIVCDPKTDLFNPNVIRASLGCVFTKQVASCTNEEALEYLKNKKIRTIATTPYTDTFYFNEDLAQPTAIVMGTEADGLSDFWLQNANIQTKVPMLGEADSLNVSACLSVVIYEAVRQRIADK